MTSIKEYMYNLTKQAFEKNEIKNLLMGENGYDYHVPNFSINIPTHKEYCFEYGLYPLYKELDDKEKKELYESLYSTLISLMLSDNSIERWWFISILYGMKWDEDKYNCATFKMFDKIMAEFKPEYILNVKTDLLYNKKYLGSNFKLGLWGDILRYNKMFEKYFHIKLLGGYYE